MADLVLGKYLYHQPLYRQAKALEWESGVKLSAATLCQTIARIAEAVEPVVRAMAEEMWRAPCVQMDLTPVRCLSREHDGGSFMGQMWVCAVPGGDVLYTWDQSKAATVAEGIMPERLSGHPPDRRRRGAALLFKRRQRPLQTAPRHPARRLLGACAAEVFRGRQSRMPHRARGCSKSSMCYTALKAPPAPKA